MFEAIKLVLIDDHEMVLQGLSALLESQPGVKVVKQYSSGYDAIEDIESIDVDMVLSDINMPLINGFDTSQAILKKKPDLKIIMLSMEISDAYIEKAQNEGILGYVSKRAPIEDLHSAIKEVYAQKSSFVLVK